MVASTVPLKQSPTFPDILQQALDNHQSRVWTALPARVQDYSPTTQRVSAQPLVPVAYYDEDDERHVEPLPVIGDVPVMFPGCGPYRMTWPVALGDLGLLIFTSCSLDRWLEGDGRAVADPVEERRNHLSDAVFVPGIFASSTPTAAPMDALVVHADAIKLGGDDATDPVVRKSDLDAVVSRLEGHTHKLPTLSGASYNSDTAGPSTSDAEGTFTTPACSLVTRSK